MTTDLPHCTVVHDFHAACSCGWQSPHVFLQPERYATWHRLAVGETIDNPYLHAFLTPASTDRQLGGEFTRRDPLVSQYAWAIPTEVVARKLAALSPICDLGCGTGYWAKILTDVGAEVLAVDASPPLDGDNHWHSARGGFMFALNSPLAPRLALRHFVDIVRGDAETFDVPATHALMLCWPPLGAAMSEIALTRYTGDRVIYVGEGEFGCTGSEGFHAQLDAEWDRVARYQIPQWDGLHDEVYVYARKLP